MPGFKTTHESAEVREADEGDTRKKEEGSERKEKMVDRRDGDGGFECRGCGALCFLSPLVWTYLVSFAGPLFPFFFSLNFSNFQPYSCMGLNSFSELIFKITVSRYEPTRLVSLSESKKGLSRTQKKDLGDAHVQQRAEQCLVFVNPTVIHGHSMLEVLSNSKSIPLLSSLQLQDIANQRHVFRKKSLDSQ